MKDNVLDLLIYLFENYMSADDEPRPDRQTLKLELDKAGFVEPDISRALEWLDGLSGEQLGKVAEATARRRGRDPDQPPHLMKVTETL